MHENVYSIGDVADDEDVYCTADVHEPVQEETQVISHKVKLPIALLFKTKKKGYHNQVLGEFRINYAYT